MCLVITKELSFHNGLSAVRARREKQQNWQQSEPHMSFKWLLRTKRTRRVCPSFIYSLILYTVERLHYIIEIFK